MLRGLSIVICSLLSLQCAWAVNYNAPGYFNGTPGVYFSSLGASESYQVYEPGQNPFYPQINVRSRFIFRDVGGFVQYLSVRNEDSGAILLNRQQWNNNSWVSWISEPGYEPPAPDQVEEFSWTFGPEWAGSVLQIKDANGNSLGTWGLPSVIGPEGYTLSSSVSAASLEGASVFLDGVNVSDLAAGSMASGPSGFDVDRPSYGFSFDASYAEGDWQLRRSDGTIAASGSVSSLGTVLEGRITIGGDEIAEVYTRVPGGDGMGAVWVPSGVIVQGSGTTYYSFVNNPNRAPQDPVPPFPTPTPAASPSPAPSPPTSGTNSVTAGPTPEGDVEVTVGELEALSVDSGEDGALAATQSAGEKIRQLLDKTKQMFDNVSLTFGEFNKLAFGGVGQNCQLAFGPVNIDIGNLVPGWLRNGMKLIILLTFASAAYRLMMWTFS